MCAVKSGADTRERNAAFFLALYAIPNITIVYFYYKTEKELRRRIVRDHLTESAFLCLDLHPILNLLPAFCLPPSRCLSPSTANEFHPLPSVGTLTQTAFRKADAHLQISLNVQLRNNALVFVVCALPLQVDDLISHIVPLGGFGDCRRTRRSTG